jgi:hypothetical protein
MLMNSRDVITFVFFQTFRKGGSLAVKVVGAPVIHAP